MMEKTQTKPLTAAQQRQRDKKRRTWLRAGVQLFFFVSMPGDVYKRQEAAQVLHKLRKLGIAQTVMMTGDSDRTARALSLIHI